jgi:hypothetical protein
MRRSRAELRLLRQGQEKSINYEAPHNVIFSNLLLLFFQPRLSSPALNDALLQFLQSTQYYFHGGGIPPSVKLIKKFPTFMDDLLPVYRSPRLHQVECRRHLHLLILDDPSHLHHSSSNSHRSPDKHF